MPKINTLILTAAFAALVTGEALAAPPVRHDQDDRVWSATLGDQPGLRGRCVEFTSRTNNLARARFNDRAYSARFHGRWVVCTDDHFRGICRSFHGDVMDFGPLGGQISSLNPAPMAY